MAAISNKMGSAPPGQERGSYAISISSTAQQLLAPVTGLASKIISPLTQTNGTFDMYAYLSSKAGSPTGIYCTIYKGATGAENPLCPDISGSIVGISTGVDLTSQSVNTWTNFSLTGITLTGGLTYWAVLSNYTDTPNSNNVSFLIRGYNGNTATARFLPYTTTNSFQSAPTAGTAGSDSPMIVKFGDGSIYGNPYVVSSVHGSDQNDRGNRYTFDAPTNVAGVYIGSNMISLTLLTGLKVYQGTREVSSNTLDLNQINYGGAVYFPTPITFAPNTPYDVVMKYSSSVGSVGNRVSANFPVPNDVLNCMPTGLQYVDGPAPGSYTTTGGMCALYLLVNNILAGETSSAS